MTKYFNHSSMDYQHQFRYKEVDRKTRTLRFQRLTEKIKCFERLETIKISIINLDIFQVSTTALLTTVSTLLHQGSLFLFLLWTQQKKTRRIKGLVYPFLNIICSVTRLQQGLMKIWKLLNKVLTKCLTLGTLPSLKLVRVIQIRIG